MVSQVHWLVRLVDEGLTEVCCSRDELQLEMKSTFEQHVHGKRVIKLRKNLHALLLVSTVRQ